MQELEKQQLENAKDTNNTEMKALLQPEKAKLSLS
jgi:hypothetical protein